MRFKLKQVIGKASQLLAEAFAGLIQGRKRANQVAVLHDRNQKRLTLWETGCLFPLTPGPVPQGTPSRGERRDVANN